MINIKKKQKPPILNPNPTIVTGQITAKTSPTQLPEILIKNCSIKSSDTNTGNTYVGSATVSTSNGFQLQAGEAVNININNLSKLYVISDTGTEVVTWIAEVQKW